MRVAPFITGVALGLGALVAVRVIRSRRRVRARGGVIPAWPLPVDTGATRAKLNTPDRITYVPNVANPAAPTLAELRRGIDVTPYFMRRDYDFSEAPKFHD